MIVAVPPGMEQNPAYRPACNFFCYGEFLLPNPTEDVTMDPAQLYHLLAKKPFEPVRVRLKDGRSYDIPARNLAIVGVTYLDIGFQAGTELPGRDYWYICDSTARSYSPSGTITKQGATGVELS
jgi:hypothetical protein